MKNLKTFIGRGMPTLCLASAIGLVIACSSNDPTPTSSDASVKTNARLLVGSETTASIGVIDLEQSALETSSKTFTKAASLQASPEGNFAFVVQASGNKVNLLKKGTSATTTATTTTSTSTDEHGHSHKARFGAGHDHGSETTSSSAETSSTSSTSSSSVTELDFSITGTGLGKVLAKGQWISIQFQNQVIAVSEEKLESYYNSINEKPYYTLTTTLPGIPLDEEHMALGGNVVEISDSALVSAGGNATGNLIMSSNILSLTRSKEGTGLYGTDQGVYVIAKHTESGNTSWEDFIVAYPEVPESQIFLAGEHEHEGEEHEEEHGEDEHKEVEENRAASMWATHDALGHAFAHLTHENHSAGVYLLEIGEETGSWEYLADTSSSTVRPVAMDIAKVTETGEEDKYYLLILMSNGNLRIHDAKDEGKFIKEITGVVSSMDDFHAGEGNYPGLACGLNKVYVGNPKNNLITQIDLHTYKTELTWSVNQKPNSLLILGQSTLSEGADHDHDHDH